MMYEHVGEDTFGFWILDSEHELLGDAICYAYERTTR